MIQGALDRYGVPMGFFGPVPQDFYGLVGALTMTSAVVEDRLCNLLTIVAVAPQDRFAGWSASQVITELQKKLDTRPKSFADDVRHLLARLQIAFEFRHEIVHSLWPKPTLGRAFGHRGVTAKKRHTQSDFSATIVTNEAEIKKRITTFLELFTQIEVYEQRSQQTENQPIPR